MNYALTSCRCKATRHAFSTVGQSTSSAARTQGYLTAAACHSRQAGSAIIASI